MRLDLTKLTKLAKQHKGAQWMRFPSNPGIYQVRARPGSVTEKEKYRIPNLEPYVLVTKRYKNYNLSPSNSVIRMYIEHKGTIYLVGTGYLNRVAWKKNRQYREISPKMLNTLRKKM